jgi:acyl carrier protein
MSDPLHLKVEEIVRDVCGDDRIALQDSTTSSEVPGWDSLAHVNIVFAIEEEFEIEFDDDEIAAFTNIGELKDRIRQKVAS